MLTCGIVGLPMAGKTTLYNLLTGNTIETSRYLSGKAEANVATAPIPDKRIDFLSNIYKPKKTTYAQIQISDVPGLVSGSSKGEGVGNKFLNDIRNVDAIVHIVRAFEDDSVMHVEGSVDPMRDISIVGSELLVADLQLVETRLERISSSRKQTPENKLELPVFERLRDWLMEEKWIKDMDISDDEKEVLTGYGFFTDKPLILVVNLDEDQAAKNEYPGKDEVESWCRDQKCKLIELCCKVESEISELNEEERDIFMAEYGIEEPGIYKVARVMYEALGLISFFTVGEDEVRAWTISIGSTAKRAGRAIHSDIERGFIRAEVVSYDDFRELGSMAETKDKGKFRLEGKDYIVKDGDIINFRFNV